MHCSCAARPNTINWWSGVKEKSTMEVTLKDLACNVSKNELTLKVLPQTNCSSLTDTHHYILDVTGINYILDVTGINYILDVTGINNNNQQKTKKGGGGGWGGGVGSWCGVVVWDGGVGCVWGGMRKICKKQRPHPTPQKCKERKTPQGMHSIYSIMKSIYQCEKRERNRFF